MKQTVRTTVEPDVFAHLQYLADQQGVSLFVYARDVLTAHAVQHGADETVPSMTALTEVTSPQWLALRKWVAADPSRLNGYPGPRDWKDPANRAAVYAYAVNERGFSETG